MSTSFVLVGQNTNKIYFMKEASVLQDDDKEIMSFHLSQGIIPDMSKLLSTVEGLTEMQNLWLSFNAD